MSRPSRSVADLFRPSSVAVVGASPNNSVAMANLVNPGRLGYSGRVAGVHPRHSEVAGVECSPSLSALDFIPDAVVVAVNRDRTPAVLEEAAELGVGLAVVFGIGFAEAGEHGREVQDRMVDLARAKGMLVAGPNCQGIINFVDGVALYIEEVEPYEAGSVGLIAQSGSVATALINNRRGTRWRYVASTGNEAMVDAATVLEFMVEDESCGSVCLFLESIRDKDRFFAACDRAADLGKPVIVLKAGRTEQSMKAAEAHSGALAVPDRLVEALFRRHGVIRVDSLEEMLETVNALQVGKRSGGNRIATVAASGGQIQLALDSAADAGLRHDELADQTQAELRRILPDFLPATNPLDYFGMEDEERKFPQLIEALASDPNVDAVVTLVDQTDYPTGEGRYDFRLQTAIELAQKGSETLLVVLDAVGGVSPPARVERAGAAGVPLLSGIETGMRAVHHALQFGAVQAVGPNRIAAKGRVPENPRLPAGSAGVIGGIEAIDLLADHGISVVPTHRVESVEAGIELSEQIGFPLVAKLADPSIAHKTELGGVRTGIRDIADLQRTLDDFSEAGHLGALLQPQIDGIELILGVTRHPELGSFLVIGLGGIWTEVLDQVVIVPAGLRQGEAEVAIRRLPGFEILLGARGAEIADLAGLVEMIECLDRFTVGLGNQVSGIDINPVIANRDGFFAVDAAIVRSGQPRQSVD